MIEIRIIHGNKVQFPSIEGSCTVTWERKGSAGKLEFSTLPDGLEMEEGDGVGLSVDGTPMFFGFLFVRKTDRDGRISVTAYDQMRYLKNRDTVTAEGLKASDLLRKIANDFRLNIGQIEDTGYVFETIVEENTSLLDMLQNALSETLRQTGRLFVLFDDCGTLCLKNINSMGLNLLIDGETAENFEYSSSIDGDSYNKIKLSYSNEETGKRELFVTQNGELMNKWGVLQYFEEVQTATGAAAKADALLKLYGSAARGLSVKGAFGDARVRGGSAVAVRLDLGDGAVNRMMVVETVNHRFEEGVHRMDLKLIGGDFFD